MSHIIEAQELLKFIGTENLRILDASYGKDAHANYKAEHLLGAVFVDLDAQLSEITDNAAHGGRHPLPKIEDFLGTLSGLGISHRTHVVIYDDKKGAGAAARLWWMLKAVGHRKVQVLNGGIQEALKVNFPTSSIVGPLEESAQMYDVDHWKLRTAEMNEVEDATRSKRHLIIDVREEMRYAGKTEPIDLIAGHIPGAINIPFSENLDDMGLFKSPEELKLKYGKAFEGHDSGNIIVHCGSGVTACHTLLAIAYAGLKIPKLYVGSWSEWSRNQNSMVLGKQS